MRTIWMARLVIAVAVVMVVGAAAFAAYESRQTGARLAPQANSPDRAAGRAPTTTAPDRSVGLAPTTTPSGALGPTTTPSPRLAPNGNVALSGRLTVSGAVSETRDGTVQFFGGGGGPSCEGQARTFTGVSFFYPPELGSHSELDLTVYLPRGVMGPGTYNVTDLGVDYNPPAPSTNFQIWRGTTVSPGPTQAVLVLRPDASGTVTATGLRPVYFNEPSSQPLDISLSFSCG